MKRSIVEVSMPQHYRDSSLSSLESLFSNFTDNEIRQNAAGDNASNATENQYQHQPYHHHHHGDHYHDYQATIDYPPPPPPVGQPPPLYCSSSFDEGYGASTPTTSFFSTMQEEYDSSTKQPTPGRPKMARILASSSPEITALCRKTFATTSSTTNSLSNSTSGINLPVFDYANDDELHPKPPVSFGFHSFNWNDDDDPVVYDFPTISGHANRKNSYNLSSDSSNFSMSSSSMESVSYPAANRTSSASISTWEDPPPSTFTNRRATLATKRFSGSCTVPTVSSTTATAASTTTTTTSETNRPRPVYVNVGSPSNEETSGLNYSGSDLELEVITASLNTIQIYQPEPRIRLNSASSFASAPTRSSTIGTATTGACGLQRASLHRRMSCDSLPTPEMIMYETVPLNSSLPPPPTLSLPPPPPPTPPPLQHSLLQRSSSAGLVLPPSASPLLSHRSSGSSVGSRHRRNTTQIVMPPMKPVS